MIYLFPRLSKSKPLKDVKFPALIFSPWLRLNQDSACAFVNTGIFRRPMAAKILVLSFEQPFRFLDYTQFCVNVRFVFEGVLRILLLCDVHSSF